MISYSSFRIFLVIFSILIATRIYSQTQGEIPWPTLSDSPWPMMSHDPQCTGRSPYVGPKTANVVWIMDMPYGVPSGPALGEDGTIYFGTNTWLHLVDTTNYFYAANPDGTLKWVLYTREVLPTDSGFLIGADSTVYFASQGGFIYAVDFKGNLKWKNDYGMNFYSHVMNLDKDSSIYVASADNHLYAINRINGKVKWNVSYDSGFLGSSATFSPDGQTLYIAGHDNNLYALNLDGSQKWKFSCGPVSVVPTVDNEGNIYIVAQFDSVGLYSLYPDGTVRWNYNFADWHSNRSLLYCATIDKEGNIYFPGPIQGQRKIISLDYYGNFRWEYLFEDPDEDIYVPLICDADGTVYCGSTWGYYYYAISSEGLLLWKLPLDDYDVDNSGAIGSDGTLYIGTHLSSTTIGQQRTLIAIRDTGASFANNDIIDLYYSLEQNYPNPFNPVTTISYSLPESASISLKVFDIIGNEVITLEEGIKSEGRHLIHWNGTDNLANIVPAGVYFVRMKANGFQKTIKSILIK